MFKNTSGQKIAFYAIDTATNLQKTGDAANITAYVSKDYGAVTALADVAATELDSANAKGLYLFDVSQAESNGNTLIFSAKSTTAGIRLDPKIVETTAPRYTGTAQNGSNNSITMQAGTTSLQCCPGDVVELTGGSGAGESSYVTSFDPVTLIANIDPAWPVTNPNNTTTYELKKEGGGVPASITDFWSDTEAPDRTTTGGNITQIAGVPLQTDGSGTQNMGGP